MFIARQGARGLRLPDGDDEEVLGAACEGLVKALRKMDPDAPEAEKAAFLRMVARNAAIGRVRLAWRTKRGAKVQTRSGREAQEAFQALLHHGDNSLESRAGAREVAYDDSPESWAMAREVALPLLEVRAAVHEQMGPDPIRTLRRLFCRGHSVEMNLLKSLAETIRVSCGLDLTHEQIREVIS